MEEVLNEFFGFEVKWSKLPKEDLQRLYDFFNNPENIISRLLKVMGIDEFVRVTSNTVMHRIVDEKPARKLLKDLLIGGGR